MTVPNSDTLVATMKPEYYMTDLTVLKTEFGGDGLLETQLKPEYVDVNVWPWEEKMWTNEKSMLWYEYSLLVSLLLVSYIFGAIAFYRHSKAADAQTAYGKAMRFLPIPFLLSTFYFALFPVVEYERFVFWQTPMSNFLIAHGLNLVGSVCLVVAIAIALRKLDTDLTGGRKCVSLVVGAALAFAVYGQAVTYYAGVTQDVMWELIGLVATTLASVAVFPVVASMWRMTWGLTLEGAGQGKQTKHFLARLSLFTFVHPIYVALYRVPTCLYTSNCDWDAVAEPLELGAGAADAFTTQVYSRDITVWQQNLSWFIALLFFVGIAHALSSSPMRARLSKRKAKATAAKTTVLLTDKPLRVVTVSTSAESHKARELRLLSSV